MPTVTISGIELYYEQCCQCGVLYGFSTEYESGRRLDGKSWLCPNGHTLHFGDNECERMRKRAIRAEHQRDQAKADAKHWKEMEAHTEHRRRAEKAAHTRTKNRVALGVCPCCNRHFANLERHMKTKHPDYPGED